MQKLSVVFVFAVIVAGFAVCESVGIGRADASNPVYPGKCVLDKNTILSPGQMVKAPIKGGNPCAGITCLDNGRVVLKTCPAEAPPKGCKLRDFVNTNRNYPECCERKFDCSKF